MDSQLFPAPEQFPSFSMGRDEPGNPIGISGKSFPGSASFGFPGMRAEAPTFPGREFGFFHGKRLRAGIFPAGSMGIREFQAASKLRLEEIPHPGNSGMIQEHGENSRLDSGGEGAAPTNPRFFSGIVESQERPEKPLPVPFPADFPWKIQEFPLWDLHSLDSGSWISSGSLGIRRERRIGRNFFPGNASDPPLPGFFFGPGSKSHFSRRIKFLGFEALPALSVPGIPTDRADPVNPTESRMDLGGKDLEFRPIP